MRIRIGLDPARGCRLCTSTRVSVKIACIFSSMCRARGRREATTAHTTAVRSYLKGERQQGGLV
eukprot:2771988-Prymnesium_polylepis.1